MIITKTNVMSHDKFSAMTVWQNKKSHLISFQFQMFNMVQVTF